MDSWVTTSLRLANEIQQLDKKPEDVFKMNDPILRLCAQEYKENAIERSKIVRELRSKYYGLKHDLNEVQSTLSSKSSKISDGSALRFILEEFEMKLTSAKVQSKTACTDFGIQTESLFRDIEVAAHEIEKWIDFECDMSLKSQRITQQANKASAKESVKRSIEHQQKLGEIERQLIIIGGPYGGWFPRDHDVFLRAWTQAVIVPTTAELPLQAERFQTDSGFSSNTVHGVSNEPTPPASKPANPQSAADDKENRTQIRNDIDASHDPSPNGLNTQSINGTTNTANCNAPKRQDWIGPRLVIPASQHFKLVRKLNPLLTHIDTEAIDEHIKWYLDFLTLIHAKKRLLSDWKQSKLKSSAHDNGVADIGATDNMNGLREGYDTITFDEGADGGNVTAEERQQLKLRIAQWRDEKEKIAKEKQEAAERAAIEEQVEEEERRRKRQQEIRVQINLWRELREREGEEDTERVEREAIETARRRASSVDPAELQRRHERDLESAKQRRKSISRNQIQSKADRVAALDSDILFKAERDPLRLITLTKTTLANQITAVDLDLAEHKRLTSTAHNQPLVLSGRDLMFNRRAVPSWLKPRK